MRGKMREGDREGRRRSGKGKKENRGGKGKGKKGETLDEMGRG